MLIEKKRIDVGLSKGDDVESVSYGAQDDQESGV